MEEYIEREAAVTVCSNQYKECLRKSDWGGDTVAWNICYGIKAIPAADVVEVPCRCKDCKHWKHFDHLGCTDFVKVCGLANYMIGANGYCLYGKRKENEG